MNFCFDAAVIGGGILGCFAARALSRYNMSVCLLERHNDVCTEITRANTAVVYGGYDSQPGTLKTTLCVRANRGFDDLCRELDVEFKRCGALMTSFGPNGEKVVRKRLERGEANGVIGLRVIVRDEILELEPNISPDVNAALYAPMVGTVNSWQLGIAAAENACENGVEMFFNHYVRNIHRQNGQYVIDTDDDTFTVKAIVNCAGLNTDTISEMVARPYFRIKPTKGDYIVLDTTAGGHINHVIFHEPEEKGKGATLVPTIDGNILLGPSETEAQDKETFATTHEGLEFVRRSSREIFPNIPLEKAIRNFAALRPNPFWVNMENGVPVVSDKSIKDYIIGQPEDAPGFFNMSGIKTPGMTCSHELGKHTALLVADYLGITELNKRYSPTRKGIVRFGKLSLNEQQKLSAENKAYANLICRCKCVTEGEILDAIHRKPGAVSIDGVKRRVSAGMGRCQGSFCSQKVAALLSRELRIPLEQVLKDRAGSYWLGEVHDGKI